MLVDPIFTALVGLAQLLAGGRTHHVDDMRANICRVVHIADKAAESWTEDTSVIESFLFV